MYSHLACFAEFSQLGTIFVLTQRFLAIKQLVAPPECLFLVAGTLRQMKRLPVRIVHCQVWSSCYIGVEVP